MEIKNLKGISNKEILSVFNESYSDYFVPFKLTEKQLTSKMIIDKTDLDLSVGIFDNQNLIAFILHGYDINDNQKVDLQQKTGQLVE